jgi:AcrR family transcriptional regulator
MNSSIIGRMARPREFDEPTVLRAAAGVFRRRGYAGASLQELTEATGLGKGSLYGAFGSKHGLYLAALDEYTRRNVGAARRELDGTDSIEDVKGYLDAAVAGSTDGSPSCLLTTATAELAGEDAPVARRVGAAFEQLSAALRCTVEGAQARGEIVDGDAEATADLLLAISRGISVLGEAGVSPERLTRAVDVAVAALALER